MDRVERTALVSIAINVGLVLLKVVLATASGSLALVADAWHSGSDIAASGLVWAGARLSRREGGRRLAIIENVVGIAIAILILWAAAGIFRRVSSAVAAQVTRLPLAIGGSLVAALGSYFAAQYKLFVGKETGSLSLTADGYHSRMDTLTTIAVIVGLMGQAMGVRLDPIAAAVVAIFVVESGIVILWQAVAGLRRGGAAGWGPLDRLTASRQVRAARAWYERVGLAAVRTRLADAFREPRVRRRVWGIAIAIGVVCWAGTIVSFVGPGHVGVVKRWGRLLDEPVRPGIHFKAPWPMDRVTRVALSRVRAVELGFRIRSGGPAVSGAPEGFYATLWESSHSSGTYEKKPEEATRLTGDENIVDMNVILFYQVADPYNYLFRVAGADDLVRLTAESVITEIAGTRALDEILTSGRESLERAMSAAVQAFLDREQLGIEITAVRLQDVHPPLEVVSAFRGVASAREERSRTINQAHAYANEVVPKARGNAEKLVREAEGYRSERVDRAHGDAERFIAMAKASQSGKDVTKTRLYIETMEQILANLETFIVSPDVTVKGYDLIMLDDGVWAGSGASAGTKTDGSPSPGIEDRVGPGLRIGPGVPIED